MGRCQPRLLTPYLDGEIEGPPRADLDDHLRGCASCAVVLDELRVAADRVRGMGRSTIPEGQLWSALEVLSEEVGLLEGALDHPIRIDREGPHRAVLSGGSDTPTAGSPIGEGPGEARAGGGEKPADGRSWWRRRSVPDFIPPPADGADASAGAAAEAEPTEEGAGPASEPEVVAAEATMRPTAGPEASGEQAAEPRASAFPQPEPLATAPPAPPWVDRAELVSADLEAEGRRAIEQAMAAVERRHAAAAGGAEGAARAAAGAPAAQRETVEAESEPAEIQSEAGATMAAGASAPAAELTPAMGEGRVRPEGAGAQAAARAAVDGGPAKAGVGGAVSGGSLAAPEAKAGAEVLAAPAAEARAAVERLREERRVARAKASRSAEGATSAPGGAVLRRLRAEPRLLAVAGGAVVAVVLLAAGVGALGQGHPKLSGTTQPQPGQSAASPAASGAALSPAPSSAAGSPAAGLTGVVSTGSGGQGYSLVSTRSGIPAAGVFRLVLVLDGSGPTPDAQIGLAPDGSLRLTATGISVSPGQLSAWNPGGPIVGIGQGPGAGLDVRLTLVAPRSYSMIYIPGPERLVIDLR